MVTFSKAIGIVGGAGPAASALLYTTILETCQKRYGSNDYNEFPEIIIDSYPFTRGNEEKIREEISRCFSKLKSAGASLFCIASNSFHGYLPDLSKIEFVNLIDEGLKKAACFNVTKSLILAAQATINLKLYERSSIKCLYPSDVAQRRISQMIREVAGGKIEESQSAELREMITEIHRQSPFDGVIIACTELPLIHRRASLSGDAFTVIDTIEVLAGSLIDQAVSL